MPHPEEAQMDSKYMKKCPASLVFREMQIDIMLRTEGLACVVEHLLSNTRP
jgi:hypothetical protein